MSKKRYCGVIKRYGNTCPVQQTKKEKILKDRIRGFAVDPHTDQLITAGSRLFNGKKSEFIRAAVRKYFEE